jgi:UDP-N-acetylmuramate dehydrogenase
MNRAYQSLIQEFDTRIKHNELLYKHTIIKTDKIADLYIETEILDDLVKIINLARKLTIPIYILGGGSGIKIPAKNIEGLVIKNNCRKFHSMGLKGKIRENQMGVEEVLVYAESGALMNQLVRYTIQEGLEGLEYQLGLPGTVGGAIVTNAKYIPRYLPMSKSVHSIKILHEDGELKNYIGQLPFFYQNEDAWEQSNDCILSVAFRMMPSDQKILWERGNEATKNRIEVAQNEK